MKTKILIIDAHPVYAPKVVGILESLTFKNIEVVTTGSRAMEVIAQNIPDIVILSATLPDMDSVALARQIKGLEKSPAMIVQTGLLTSHEAVDAFKRAGVEHIVPRREKDWKPFEDALTDIIPR
jgi:PleD family two-component response regulator